MWNLYSAPFAHSRNKPFPNSRDFRAAAAGCDFWFQSLKLPITETFRAFGAHTLKHGPALSR